MQNVVDLFRSYLAWMAFIGVLLFILDWWAFPSTKFSARIRHVLFFAAIWPMTLVLIGFSVYRTIKEASTRRTQ